MEGRRERGRGWGRERGRGGGGERGRGGEGGGGGRGGGRGREGERKAWEQGMNGSPFSHVLSIDATPSAHTPRFQWTSDMDICKSPSAAHIPAVG